MKYPDQKILVLIVAYNAERHIEKVLNRIPSSFYLNYNYQILLIDDSSTDNTYALAKLYQSLHADLNLKVIFNPSNLGYGGNQKVGYQYALDNHFGVVVLLHGDGQYAPELLEDILVPVLSGEADVVFGSRMQKKWEALKGGMPLYKYVGNRILTIFQNAVLGTRFSEFHSGYRAYSVAVLRRIPFHLNTNDFHFDTQILIQAVLGGFRVKEVSINAFYGDEICYVNGIKYAWNVVKTTLLCKAHRLSLLYRPEYDVNRVPSSQISPSSESSLSSVCSVKAVEQ